MSTLVTTSEQNNTSSPTVSKLIKITGTPYKGSKIKSCDKLEKQSNKMCKTGFDSVISSF